MKAVHLLYSFTQVENRNANMLGVILGWCAVVILLAICLLLIVVPHNEDPVLMSADPQVIKRIPGPRSLPYLGNVLMFNVPRESKFSKVSRIEDFGLIREIVRNANNLCYFSAVQFVLVK
jgi:hypothetical protein